MLTRVDQRGEAAPAEANANWADRAESLFREELQSASGRIDRVFIVLMIIQWLAAVAAALWLTPHTWIGNTTAAHLHVKAAIFLGGLLSGGAIFFAVRSPGTALSRHAVAFSQAGWSCLLIHLTGGRLETHFHVFGSLAFLSFYRDWRVLITATVVVTLDHFLRGTWWPLSVYGLSDVSRYRWMEHAAWVLFEDAFLIAACCRGVAQLREVVKRQAVLEDINQHIEAKVTQRTEELREERAFVRAVLDSVSSEICILAPDGTIVATNAAWKTFSSQNGGDGIQPGVNYLDVCDAATGDCEEGAHRIATGIRDVLTGRSEYVSSEYECHSPSEQHWYQVAVTPLRHKTGGAVVAHHDITARVLAERSLQEEQRTAAKLSLVAKYTDNAVMITDGRGRVEWVNPAFERCTGHGVETAVGFGPDALCRATRPSRPVLRRMRQSLQSGDGFDLELRARRSCGAEYWLSLECRPILDMNGVASRFIFVGRDVTRRREAEEERERLSANLQTAAHHAGMAEVATGVLHNVGNVLNSVNVSANVLLRTLSQSRVATMERAVEVIRENASDLPEFFRTDPRGPAFPQLFQELAAAWRRECDSETTELRTLLENISHIKQIVRSQQSFARRGENWSWQSPADLLNEALRLDAPGLECDEIVVSCNEIPEIQIHTDRHRVLQILVNLISNARQAITRHLGAPRRIEVNVHCSGTECRIAVSEQGMGISPENLQQLFRHGFTTRDDGHGFGLHSSALAAQSLKGRLEANSDGTGLGACFTLTLPRDSAALGDEADEPNATVFDPSALSAAPLVPMTEASS